MYLLTLICCLSFFFFSPFCCHEMHLISCSAASQGYVNERTTRREAHVTPSWCVTFPFHYNFCLIFYFVRYTTVWEDAFKLMISIKRFFLLYFITFSLQAFYTNLNPLFYSISGLWPALSSLLFLNLFVSVHFVFIKFDWNHNVKCLYLLSQVSSTSYRTPRLEFSDDWTVSKPFETNSRTGYLVNGNSNLDDTKPINVFMHRKAYTRDEKKK